MIDENDVCMILSLCENDEEKTAVSITNKCYKKLAVINYRFRLSSKERDYLRKKYNSLDEATFNWLYDIVECVNLRRKK